MNCGSVISQNKTISPAYVLSDASWSSLNFPHTVSVQAISVTSGQLVAAEVIPILFQATDTIVQNYISGVTPTASTDTASSSNASVPIRPSVAPPTNSALASHGLSTGSKAAIGVAVPIGTLLIVLAVFLLFRRRKKTSAPVELDGEKTSTAHEMHGSPGPVELPEKQNIHAAGLEDRTVEADSTPVHRELSGNPVLHKPRSFHEMSDTSPIPSPAINSQTISPLAVSPPSLTTSISRKPLPNQPSVLHNASNFSETVSSGSVPESPPPTYQHS